VTDKPRARVFVSHSTHGNIPAAYLSAVKTAITKRSRRFELLIDDSTLVPGDEWREVIYRWLDEAHAAVILMSDDALRSPWVDIEISILSFQYLRGRLLKIIPVLLTPDIEPETVAAKLQFKETFQFFRPSDPDDAAKGVIEALSERAFLQAVEQGAPPQRSAETYIAEQLEAIKFNRTIFRSLTLGWKKEPASDREAADIFSRKLIAMKFGDACAAIVNLGRQLAASTEGYDATLVRIINILKPTWVPPADASVVAERIHAKPHGRSVALRSGKSSPAFVAESLVRRAQGRPVNFNERLILQIVGPDEEDSVMDVKRQLLAKFKIGAADPATGRKYSTAEQDAVLKRKLKNHEEQQLPIVLVFPAGWTPDPTFLSKLRDEFETPTLMFADFEEGDRFDPKIVSLSALSEELALAALDDYYRVTDVYDQ
jgi:TIR domain